MNKSMLGAFLVALSILVSCSQATSKPQYKYKKPVGDGVAAKVGKITITDKELYSGIESDLYEAEKKIFDIKFNHLNQILIKKLIKQDPNSKGMTQDAYFDKYIASKNAVTEKEIQEFIKERNIPKQQINPQVKEKIKEYISMQKKDDALKVWIAEQTKGTGIEVYFEQPQRPTFDVKAGNSPFSGGENAKVEIVEFSDFQCPYCANASKVVRELKKKYGNKIKIVFKQYPLSFHTQARKAAVAALCMNKQSTKLFWKMHDAMFDDQSKLSPAKLKETAKTLGAKEAEFNKCLDENSTIAQVEKEIQEGKDLGVKSTPTFYVNGQLVAGALPLETFSELIDQELAK